MPIRIPENLPATDKLRAEGIDVMGANRADIQDIRPLQIAVLNLMPDKQQTEIMLARLLGASPLQVEMTLVSLDDYQPKNVSAAHMQSFYQSFETVRARKFDGFVITGAPVEYLPFEDVKYWSELTGILDWSQTNVFQTMALCWAGMAALYKFQGIDKVDHHAAFAGVYRQKVLTPHSLTLGFNDTVHMPVSRSASLNEAAIRAHPELQLIASCPETGPALVVDDVHRVTTLVNHLEYSGPRLDFEYQRDHKAGKNPQIPIGYYEGDDPSKPFYCSWRAEGHLFFRNWISQIYQDTPYDIDKIPNPTSKLSR